MAPRPRLHVLELCAGYGGFSLGLRLAEPSARTVCYVEREAYSVAILVSQMERGWLDQAPIWSDLATFDGKLWRGAVDLVTAGFPCQPFSAAGKRLGEADERWIWPDIARIVGKVRPGRVFLENVSLDAFRRPRADLEDMGYRVPPAVCVSAEDVGAPHRRKRWWCLATDADRARLPVRQGERRDAREKRTPAQRGREADTDTNGRRLEKQRVTKPARKQGESGGLADRLGEDWLLYAAQSLGEHWRSEPDVGRLADGTPNRVDRLRALGDGVVPQCVAAAWRILTTSVEPTSCERESARGRRRLR